MKKIVCILILLISNQLQAETDLSCAFEKPLAIGAAITAGFFSVGQIDQNSNTPISPEKRLTYFSEEQRFDPEKMFVVSPGPADHLAWDYTGQINNSYLVGYTNPVTTGFEWLKRHEGNDPEVVSKFENASIIIGVDMFYFDGGFNNCGNQDYWIDYFLNIARVNKEGKKRPVVIGTVPVEAEDAYNGVEQILSLGRGALKLVQMFGGAKNASVGSAKKLMSLPDKRTESCVNSINKAIIDKCKIEDECYIVDVHGIVDELNSKGFLAISNPTGDRVSFVSRSKAELRPNGLNLSAEGVRVLVNSIKHEMQSQAPSCTKSVN